MNIRKWAFIFAAWLVICANLSAHAEALTPELVTDFPAIADLEYPLGVEYQDVSTVLSYVAEVPHEDWTGIMGVVYNQSYYRFGLPLKGYIITPCKCKAYHIEYGDCTPKKLVVYRYNNGILPPRMP